MEQTEKPDRLEEITKNYSLSIVTGMYNLATVFTLICINLKLEIRDTRSVQAVIFLN